MTESTSIANLLNRPVIIAFILPLLIGLYGCPYSSSYKLDKEPFYNIDPSLIGKWACMVSTSKGMQPVKVIVNAKTDREYSIDFIGYINDPHILQLSQRDTLHTTAFESVVGKWRFLNIDIRGQTFITEIIYDENKLSFLPLAECFTAKYIKSGDELRVAVGFHYKTRVAATYDEPFCLKDMVRVN